MAEEARWSFVLFSTDTTAMFANSAENFFEPGLVSLCDECEWGLYGKVYCIYKPANQIYGHLQTSRISMVSNGTW